MQQSVLSVTAKNKPRALLRLLSQSEGSFVLVFTESHDNADEVHQLLTTHNIAASVLHMGRSQVERDEALQCFKFGVTPVLVSCGLGSRGLDLPDVTHVINYDMPFDVNAYVRRVGRARKGGVLGVASTLFTQNDAPMAQGLARVLAKCSQPVPDWLSSMAAEYEQHRGADAGEDVGTRAGGASPNAEGGAGLAMQNQQQEAGHGPGQQQAAVNDQRLTGGTTPTEGALFRTRSGRKMGAYATASSTQLASGKSRHR